ncbi:hypothetical protein BJV78DRAFT_1352497 [Lactifluus subvellereus]|nr:hypothetical protein BJV78DRAFT_1352497 [Lactifluus subvellereus]
MGATKPPPAPTSRSSSSCAGDSPWCALSFPGLPPPPGAFPEVPPLPLPLLGVPDMLRPLHIAFSVPSGESKRKRTDDDGVAYRDAAQPDSIKRRAVEDDEYAAPPPQKPKANLFAKKPGRSQRTARGIRSQREFLRQGRGSRNRQVESAANGRGQKRDNTKQTALFGLPAASAPAPEKPEKRARKMGGVVPCKGGRGYRCLTRIGGTDPQKQPIYDRSGGDPESRLPKQVRRSSDVSGDTQITQKGQTGPEIPRFSDAPEKEGSVKRPSIAN